MDAIRFDALTRAWIAQTNRRRTLVGVLAGAIGALGLAGADDAAAANSGKCKKKCGQCEFCEKGKCNKKDGKKRCKKGKCKPEQRGTPCGDGNCGCARAIEGDAFCAADAGFLCDEGLCANSGECPVGLRCVRCPSPGTTGCRSECSVDVD